MPTVRLNLKRKNACYATKTNIFDDSSDARPGSSIADNGQLPDRKKSLGTRTIENVMSEERCFLQGTFNIDCIQKDTRNFEYCIALRFVLYDNIPAGKV